jgi:Clp amino terminal domain, pathogenicity island component
VVPDEEPSGRYLEAIRRGFQLARELKRGCGPVHILAGISEGDGAAAAALDPGAGRSLREVVAAADRPAGNAAGYLHMQAQGAARSLAGGRGQRPEPEHLLIALLDQGTPEVLAALSAAGLDPAAARQAAVSAIGAAAGLPPVPMPQRTPAGTLDRPALPVSDLDRRAWTVLRWRQDHLPLDRLRRDSDREALLHLERAAAWRVADRVGVDEDQRYSLLFHHAEEVQRLAGGEPDRAGARRRLDRARARRGRRRPGLLSFTVGWDAWLRNRRVGLRDRWFWLRTARRYRGCPQP